METTVVKQNTKVSISEKTISDYFLDIVFMKKGDSTIIDESANNIFRNLNDSDKSTLINALYYIYSNIRR